MNTQPKALKLADELIAFTVWRDDYTDTWSSAAEELRRLHLHEQAHNEWLDKTAWIQDMVTISELGEHRADLIRKRMEQADVREKYLSEQLEQKDKEIDRLNNVIDKLVAQNGSESLISLLWSRTKG